MGEPVGKPFPSAEQQGRVLRGISQSLSKGAGSIEPDGNETMALVISTVRGYTYAFAAAASDCPQQREATLEFSERKR